MLRKEKRLKQEIEQVAKERDQLKNYQRRRLKNNGVVDLGIVIRERMLERAKGQWIQERNELLRAIDKRNKKLKDLSTQLSNNENKGR